MSKPSRMGLWTIEAEACPTKDISGAVSKPAERKVCTRDAS